MAQPAPYNSRYQAQDLRLPSIKELNFQFSNGEQPQQPPGRPYRGPQQPQQAPQPPPPQQQQPEASNGGYAHPGIPLSAQQRSPAITAKRARTSTGPRASYPSQYAPYQAPPSYQQTPPPPETPHTGPAYYQHQYVQARPPNAHPPNPYPSPAPPPPPAWSQVQQVQPPPPQQPMPPPPSHHQHHIAQPPPPPPQQTPQHPPPSYHQAPPPPFPRNQTPLIHHHPSYPPSSQPSTPATVTAPQSSVETASRSAVVYTPVSVPDPVDRASLTSAQGEPPRIDTLSEIWRQCNALYAFANRYATMQTTQPSAEPNPNELTEMSKRARAVVKLLEEFKRVAKEATPAFVPPAYAPPPPAVYESVPSPEDVRPPKRPWEDISQDAPEVQPDFEQYPVQSDFEQYPASPTNPNTNEADASEGPSTTAEQDMELIRTKRATTTATAIGTAGQPKSKYRKRSGQRASPPGKCHSCNIRETPEWRRGPDGARTLCNACGLHYAKMMRRKDKNGNGDIRIDMETLRASARAAEGDKNNRKASSSSVNGGSIIIESSKNANTSVDSEMLDLSGNGSSSGTMGGVVVKPQGQMGAPSHHTGSFLVTMSNTPTPQPHADSAMNVDVPRTMTGPGQPPTPTAVLTGPGGGFAPLPSSSIHHPASSQQPQQHPSHAPVLNNSSTNSHSNQQQHNSHRAAPPQHQQQHAHPSHPSHPSLPSHPSHAPQSTHAPPPPPSASTSSAPPPTATVPQHQQQQHPNHHHQQQQHPNHHQQQPQHPSQHTQQLPHPSQQQQPHHQQQQHQQQQQQQPPPPPPPQLRQGPPPPVSAHVGGPTWGTPSMSTRGYAPPGPPSAPSQWRR